MTRAVYKHKIRRNTELKFICSSFCGLSILNIHKLQWEIFYLNEDKEELALTIKHMRIKSVIHRDIDHICWIS